MFKIIHVQKNVSKFLDRQAWANSVDPDQTSFRFYTVCHSVSLFWIHFSVVKATLFEM